MPFTKKYMITTEKTAIITGGSSGIGFAIAQKFAANGIHLILISRDKKSLEIAKEKLSAFPISIFLIAKDISKPEHIPDIVSQVLSLTGQINIFINNAGGAKFASVESYTSNDYDTLFDFNVKAPFLMIQGFLPLLKASRGTIVNISTYWASKMVKGRHSSLYSASRGAMASMILALANELGEYGIRVNAIAPGSTESESFIKWRAGLSDEAAAAFEGEIAHQYPLGRLGNPKDIAEAVYFLASESAAWITGQVIHVDGGFTIR